MRFATPYAPPRVPGGIELDLTRNEGRRPDATLLASLQQQPNIVNRYPSTSRLTEMVATLRSVSSEQVLVTAGADDALLRCCSALLEPGTRAVTTTPTFEMVARYALLQRADLVEVPWRGADFPTEEVTARTEPGAVCLVVSPNNPTGEVLDSASLARLADRFEYVVLDAAYTEFSDVDLTSTAIGIPNVIMVRTLSKAWGLAGLRVGYAIADPAMIGLLSRHGSPYPVSRPSLVLAEAVLESSSTDAYVGSVRKERDVLERLLDRIGLHRTSSHGNFVYFESSESEAIHAGLLEKGIAVRRFDHIADAIRISLPGDPAEFEKLCKALREVATSRKADGKVTS